MNNNYLLIASIYKKGMTTAQIFKMLKPLVSGSGVFKVFKRFRDIGSYLPKVRSTIPRPVRTIKFIYAIRNKIMRNSQRSARKMAKEAKVSCMTIQNVLKNDIKLRPHKKVEQYNFCQALHVQKDWTEKKFFSRV